MNRTTLENPGAGVTYVIDFDRFYIAAKADGKTLILPLSDVLNIAAIYKAGQNEAAAGRRKERAVKLFGSQQHLDFKEK